MSQEIEIGLGKKGRLGYALDDVAIVPSRRTRDPEDVSTSWQIDAYEFDVPVIGAPMDSVTSPATAIAMGKMGALGVLDLEGLWTRYEDPTPLLDEIAGLPADQATERIQQIYAEPVKPELITQRLHEIRAAGVTVAGALSPQRTQQFYSTVVDAGVDLFVIRGTVVSAEHVSSGQEPLNLKKFIYDLDVPVIVGGASNYTAALHLMRTGAAGVLGRASAAARSPPPARPLACRPRWPPPSPTWPRPAATTWTNPAAATCRSSPTAAWATPAASSRPWPSAPTRSCSARRWPAPPRPPAKAPTGVPKPATRRCRAATAPRSARSARLEQVLFGPSHQADGKTNFIGALKRAMASTGYVDVKNFQRCGMVVNPYSAR